MYWKAIAAGGAVLAIAAVAVAVYYFWPFGESADELRLPGVVEIQEVRLGRASAAGSTKWMSPRATRSRRTGCW